MKKFLNGIIRTAKERTCIKKKSFRGAWDNIRLLTTKYGYYAGLLLLLAALGFASNAYRNGQQKAETPIADIPVEVSAVITPEPTVTPQPVAEEEKLRYIMPVEGPVLNGFSEDKLIWSDTLSVWKTHAAIDISAEAAQSVCACADGIVKDAYSDPLWGNVIVIEHPDGMESVYANLNTLNLVEIGQAVDAGETISAVGKSALVESEMPWHLHFELKDEDGKYVDFIEFSQLSEDVQ